MSASGICTPPANGRLYVFAGLRLSEAMQFLQRLPGEATVQTAFRSAGAIGVLSRGFVLVGPEKTVVRCRRAAIARDLR